MDISAPFQPGSTRTAAQVPDYASLLGMEYTETDATYGYRKLRLVYNNSGADISATDAVVADDGKSDLNTVIKAALTSDSSRFRGVAVVDIPAGSLGWVVYHGKALITAGTGGISADSPLGIGGSVAGTFVDNAEGVIRETVGTGASAATNIGIAGIDPDDTLLAVKHFDVSVPSMTDVIDDADITSAGNIQLATTNTATDQVIVTWRDRSAEVIAQALAAISATQTGVVHLIG